MRLVDADKLIELCDIMADICDGIGAIWEQFRIAVEWSPVVDAEPVVRCKDCIHCVDRGKYSECKYWLSFTSRNGFCHKGERREDEAN